MWVFTVIFIVLVRGSYDHPNSSSQRQTNDDRDLSARFKLNISDDGDGKFVILQPVMVMKNNSYFTVKLFLTISFLLVGFADEPPTWGHPPDPKVQSKSFKRLQKHLQDHEEDGMLMNMLTTPCQQQQHLFYRNLVYNFKDITQSSFII